MKRTEFDEWLFGPENVFGTFGAPTSPFAAFSVKHKGYEEEATTKESPFHNFYFYIYIFFLIFIFYSYLNETWMVGGSFL